MNAHGTFLPPKVIALTVLTEAITYISGLDTV